MLARPAPACAPCHCRAAAALDLLVVAVAVRPPPHWLCSVWSPACRGMVIRSKAGGRTDGRTDGPSISGAYAQIGLSVGHWHPAAAAPPPSPPPPCSKRPSSSTGEPHSCYTIQSNDEERRERDDRAREKNLIPGTPDAERGTLLSLPPTQSLKLLMMMLGNGTWCGSIYTGTV